MKLIKKKYPKRCANCLNYSQNRGIGGKCKTNNTEIKNPFKTVCKKHFEALYFQYV